MASQPKVTTYANIVSLRITSAELILDFGTQIPESGQQAPTEFDPEVRVILGVQATEALAKALTRVAADLKTASEKQSQADGPSAANKAQG